MTERLSISQSSIEFIKFADILVLLLIGASVISLFFLKAAGPNKALQNGDTQGKVDK